MILNWLFWYFWHDLVAISCRNLDRFFTCVGVVNYQASLSLFCMFLREFTGGGKFIMGAYLGINLGWNYVRKLVSNHKYFGVVRSLKSQMRLWQFYHPIFIIFRTNNRYFYPTRWSAASPHPTTKPFLGIIPVAFIRLSPSENTWKRGWFSASRNDPATRMGPVLLHFNENGLIMFAFGRNRDFYCSV